VLSREGAEKVSTDNVARLALGTAQFGLDYGIANRSGRVSEIEVAAILNRARAAGIDTLDTAIAYGSSEVCLGRAGISGWHVITKVPPLPQNTTGVDRWVRDQIDGSLRRLGIARLEAVLVHRSRDLLGAHGATYLRTLDDLKRAGLTRAVGVSIYDPEELERVWPIWRPDLVQAPCNVLDRRLINSGWLGRMASSGVRVHLRSAFLQGLLLMKPADRPAAFAPWKEILNRWAAWCEENEVSQLQGAMAFARTLRGVEHLVIGLDSAEHLQEILALGTVPGPVPPQDIFSNDLDLIDPSLWVAR
jgi:aryl-alcohol dehydrogenase-like predicted oxidoreductase